MNENWTKFIEMLLQGELSKEDTDKLNAELERNPDMRKSVEQQKRVHEIAKRSGERAVIKNVGRSYQFQRKFNTGLMSVLVAGLIATAAYFTVNHFARKAHQKVTQVEIVDPEKYENLHEKAELDNCPIVYFEHNGKDATFMSPKGVLISVPKKTFVLDGKPYKGDAVIQYQEALDATTIVKAGLSTTSGDRLLETQGMFGLKAFTPDGRELKINDKDGVYLQVPVDENKKGMQLFQGVKNDKGEIDWQNPAPIEKLPVQANMLDLDLFPSGFEDKLDELKWNKKKKQRDSLYLSFENENSSDNIEEKGMIKIPSNHPVIAKAAIPDRKLTPEEIKWLELGNVPRTNKEMTKLDAMNLAFLRPGNDPELIQLRDAYKRNNKFWFQKFSNANILNPTNWVVDGFTTTYSGLSGSRRDIPAFHYKMNGNQLELTLGYFPIQQISVTQAIELPDGSETVDGSFVANGANMPNPVQFTSSVGLDVKYISTRVNESLGERFYESKYLIDFVLPNQKDYFLKGKMNPSVFNNIGEYQLNLVRNDAALDTVSDSKCFLPPSKVLAIWKKEFNGTILATKDFEKRMTAIHSACNEEVFDVYANQINSPLWKLDEQVVRMGYASFQKFADERVGALKQDNAHMNTMRQFYQSNVSRLKDMAKKDKNVQIAIQMAWDRKVRSERNSSVNRNVKRVEQAFQEEYKMNLNNVLNQLGRKKVVGVTIRGNSYGAKHKPSTERFDDQKVLDTPTSNVYNIDRFTRENTRNRTSGTFRDKSTGKKVKLVYNKLKAKIENAKEYGQLFMYLLPRQLNSFQRVNPLNGAFDYSLNNDIEYDAVFVGINESGYFLAEKKNVTAENLGVIKLKSVSVKQFERRIEHMNEKRNSKPMSISSELTWLKTERKDYIVQTQRKEMAKFRNTMRGIVYPCSQNHSRGE